MNRREAKRRKNRRLNQSDRCSNDGSVCGEKYDDIDERNQDVVHEAFAIVQNYYDRHLWIVG
jgi:hypothetical protein